MKILIVTQHYWPENFRITDIAESLVTIGHQVTVLCGLPNYPQGHIYKEYKNKKNRRQTHNGVSIIRVKEIARRNTFVFRFLNYWSFPYYAKKRVRKIDEEFDFVLVNEVSPIMVATPAILYGKKHNKPILMYEMDLWPESILAGGIKKDSFIYKYYRRLSAKIYSKCDMIITATKEHIGYIKNLPGCNSLNIEYLPQYAEPLFENNNFANGDNGIIDLVFAGNIGKAQSLKTIIDAASILKNNNKIKFHIVGGGSEYNKIKSYSDSLSLSNTVFYGEKPLNDMLGYYNLADAMIVSLEDKPYAEMTIPGKVQSYMAAGKAIIGCINGSCHNLIIENKIGYSSKSEDSVALADIISKFNYKHLVNIGCHAKEVYKKYFSKDLFFKNLEKYIAQTIEEFNKKIL